MSRSPDPTDRAADLPTAAFDYDLPAELIAHHPAAERDASRLLVVDRSTATFTHRHFRDIQELIDPGDILVLNETRVIPARLLGRRRGGGEAEIVLLHPATEAAPSLGELWPHRWRALVRPGSKLRAGRTIAIADDLAVDITAVHEDGTREVVLHTPLDVRSAIEKHGRMPLPPYIERAAESADRERYQTVFARAEGSVAAPTAGLHFTPALLESMRKRGVEVTTVVLHVGVGTFRSVDVADPAEHVMHADWYQVTAAEAERMNVARARGGKIWAVGTTVTRTLESTADDHGVIRADAAWTRLFIRPGYRFRAVDRLITNFHLPRSTLLMLVSAFAGHTLTLRAYEEAVRERYRFYSYGDAMAIV